jgi:uncharacterized protein
MSSGRVDWLPVLVAALAFLSPAPAATAQESPSMPGAMMRPLEPSITVLGSGSVFARPDSGEITAGVVTRAVTAAQALAENSAGMERVLKALTALGLPERDIQTANISVVPQRRAGQPGAQPPEIVGYEVSNQIRVKVRDVALLGRLVDTLVGQGANVLGGIAFSVGDPAPLLDQARGKAIADARRKAEVYAKAAGVALGPLLSVRESAPGGPRFEGPRMAAGSAAPVAPGEQELQVSVTVTYAVK